MVPTSISEKNPKHSTAMHGELTLAWFGIALQLIWLRLLTWLHVTKTQFSFLPKLSVRFYLTMLPSFYDLNAQVLNRPTKNVLSQCNSSASYKNDRETGVCFQTFYFDRIKTAAESENPGMHSENRGIRTTRVRPHVILIYYFHYTDYRKKPSIKTISLL